MARVSDGDGEGGPAATPVIRKAVTLRVWVQVEGDQPAPEDFEALAMQAVRRALSRALRDSRGGLTFTILRINATTDPPDDEEMRHA